MELINDRQFLDTKYTSEMQNDISKTGTQACIFDVRLIQMEMQLSANKELFAFKKAVIQKIADWPFHYRNMQKDEQWVIHLCAFCSSLLLNWFSLGVSLFSFSS